MLQQGPAVDHGVEGRVIDGPAVDVDPLALADESEVGPPTIGRLRNEGTVAGIEAPVGIMIEQDPRSEGQVDRVVVRRR